MTAPACAGNRGKTNRERKRDGGALMPSFRHARLHVNEARRMARAAAGTLRCSWRCARVLVEQLGVLMVMTPASSSASVTVTARRWPAGDVMADADGEEFDRRVGLDFDHPAEMTLQI